VIVLNDHDEIDAFDADLKAQLPPPMVKNAVRSSLYRYGR